MAHYGAIGGAKVSRGGGHGANGGNMSSAQAALIAVGALALFTVALLAAGLCTPFMKRKVAIRSFSTIALVYVTCTQICTKRQVSIGTCVNTNEAISTVNIVFRGLIALRDDT